MSKQNTNKKELHKEEKKDSWKEFISRNKELLTQIGVGFLGFASAIIGLAGIILDHHMTREEQKFERMLIHDALGDVYWYADSPLSNSETEELVERKNKGEPVNDILKDMGKI